LPKLKKGPKSTQNYYFTKVHEDAIVEYCKTKDTKRRTDLYVQYLKPVFEEMVQKIVFSFKFTTLPNINSLIEEANIFLVTVLDNYDPNKGFKAFSFFSIITKNYFIHKVKKVTQQNKREFSEVELPKHLEQQYLATNNDYYDRRNQAEFIEALRNELDIWSCEDLKENERKVLEAVKIIYDSLEQLEIYNKKAFYLYLRELTNLSTKQIVINLNKLRARYKEFKVDWDEDY